MSVRLDGQVALVSGGSRGLGAELVSGFLDRKYGVATLSRTKTAFITDMLRARGRGHFHWSAVDGRDHDALRAFVKEAGERLGRIDVLVNNAGVAMEGLLPTTRTSDIVEVVEVNLVAALVLAQACSRFMLRQGAGCIVNISSVLGVRGYFPGFAAISANYPASKAGIVGFTKQLAVEYGRDGIRANAICPAFHEGTALGMEYRSLRTAEEAVAFETSISNRTPMGRKGLREELDGLL